MDIQPKPIMDQYIETPHIPTLKRDERERKGGAAWFGGGGSSSGLFGTGRIAASIANIFGRSSLIGAVFNSAAGPMIVFGIMLGAGVAAAMGAASVYSHWRPANDVVSAGPDLNGVGASGIHIRRPGDGSLNYLANANKGQLAQEAQTPPPQPEAKPEEKPEKTASIQSTDHGTVRDGLNNLRDQFVRKMTGNTSELGASTRAGWGGGDGKFKSMSGFDSFGGFGKSVGNPVPKFDLNRGKLTQLSRTSRLSSGKMTIARGASSRAMGQLKMARDMSAMGAAAGDAACKKTYAADAFDQKATQGGQLGGISGMNPNASIAPIGAGAPGGAGAGGTGNVNPPSDINPTAVPSGLSGLDDQAKGLSSMSFMLKILSALMIAGGIALIISGLSSTPFGWGLIAAGLALLAAGIMMLMQSLSMANQAGNIGNQIQQKYGQSLQGQAASNCAQQAASGTADPNNCSASAPQRQALNAQDTHAASQAADTEANSTYSMDGSNGSPITQSGGASQNQGSGN